MDEIDFLILGAGYTAQALHSLLKNRSPSAKVLQTSRQGNPHVYFDLEDPKSWSNLPPAKNLIWTFPPAPFERVEAFWNESKNQFDAVSIIGSTSAFSVESEHQWVDEDSPLDLSLERVRSEKFLLDQGCRLVFSSGIYGEGRNPLEWVEKSWVGKSDKFVNMIHVEDLSQFVLQSLMEGSPGSVYIASDNNPIKWRDVILLWEESGVLEGVAEKTSQKPSKRIRSEMSIKELNVSLKHKNFPESVLKLKR